MNMLKQMEVDEKERLFFHTSFGINLIIIVFQKYKYWYYIFFFYNKILLKKDIIKVINILFLNLRTIF